MEIVEFDKILKEDKREAIESVMEMLKESTNFVLLSSSNNVKTISYYAFNLSNVEAIGIFEGLKHVYLHKILPPDDNDDDPDKNEIDLCVGE